MASLKEVKGRIASVNSTRKITSAMKMVASAKLHKAQAAIESMLPYERRLHHILTDFMSNCTEVTSPFIVKREVKKVAVVVFASNTSLCGGFNANVIRHLVDLLAEYKPLGLENILVFPVGKKVADAVRKLGFRIEGDFQHMADKPSYQEAADLAADLMKRFLHGDVDTRSEVTEVLDGLQAAARLRCQGSQRRRQKVTESFLIAAPYSASHLVKVAQTEVLRPVDDNRIGIGDVYTALDNGGGHQHVVIVIHKTENNLLQFFWWHLPVPHTYAGIRHMLVQQCLQIVKTGNTVVHDEHLPVAAHLEIDRLGD